MNDLRSYMKGISDIVGHVLVMEGISARLLRVKQGPMVLSYQIGLIQPKRGDDTRVLSLASQFENYTQISPVRVVREGACIIIEFPSPDPVTPHAKMLAAHTKGSTVCLGFNRWGDPVPLLLPSYPNLLVSGPPRSGKSSAMRSLLYAAVKSANSSGDLKVEFAIMAEKVEYWHQFEQVRGFAGMFVTQEQTNWALSQLASELRELVAKRDRFRPAKVIILDDLTSLLAGGNSSLVDDLATLVTTGGSAGCYVLIGTQTTGSRAGTGGQRVEDSIMARLIYRTSSRSAAARATGAGANDIDQLTLNKGDALFVLGEQATRVATGYVSDEDIAKDLPKRDRAARYVFVPGKKGAENKVFVPQDVLDTREPDLPHIRPARKFTEDEAQMVRDWIAWKGNGWSKRQILFTVFNGKNTVLDGYLMEAINGSKEKEKAQVEA